MKKVLGILMLVTIFGVVFAYTVLIIGWAGAFLAWAGAIGLSALIVIGIILSCESCCNHTRSKGKGEEK